MKQQLNRKTELTVNAEIKSYQDKNGERQVVIRITQDDKHIWEKTPYKVKIAEWSGVKYAWVNNKRSGYAKLNSELTKIIGKYETQYAKLEDEQGVVTKEQVFNAANRQFFKEDYLAYWDNVVTEIDNYNNTKGYTTARKKILEFHGKKPLDFKHINKEWLKGFELHLRSNGLSDDSSHAIIKRIRRVWNMAIEAGVIEKKFYPFGRGAFLMKGPTGYSKKIQRLTPDELNAVFSIKYEKYSLTWYIQKGFELAFNLCGIRIEDLLTLKHSNIKDGRVTYNMKKGVTKSKEISLLIDDDIQRILNQLTKPDSKPNDYLLPFLPAGIENKSSRVYKTEVGRKTALYNKYLKIIATDAGITKNLTSHVARHSFAANMYEATKDITFVQQNLGHKNINITMGYIGVLSPAENDLKLKNAKASIYKK